MDDFSFNGSLRRIILSSDDAPLHERDHRERFLEKIAREKANKSMAELFKKNHAPSPCSRFFSHINP